MFLARLYVLALLAIQVYALRNNSFDDTNEAVITYFPSETWLSGEGGKGLGSHKSSREWTAYALFNFTGLAVYYWAPLFGADTLIKFSLDGGPSTSISLKDPNVEDGAWVVTQQSGVRASFTNLENKPHTLKISNDPAVSNGVIVDYFDVTVDNEDPSQTASSGGSSQSPSSTSSTSSKSPQPPTSALTNLTSNDADLQSKHNSLEKSFNKLKIALAVVGALFGVFICCTLVVALGGTRFLFKKGSEESDKDKTEQVKVDSSSSSKDLEKSLGPQPGLDLKAHTPGSDTTGTSTIKDTDGADIPPISVLDGSK